MQTDIDSIDLRLLDANQRGFPVVDRPFARIGTELGIAEQDVLARLERFRAQGRISRVGGTVAPNTLAASTLVAMRAPEAEIERVAAQVSEEPGINHAYLREHDWNLWFVLTGPDRDYLDNTLDRIAGRTGLVALDLPLVRAFNVDLGFALIGDDRTVPAPRPPRREAIEPGDRAILQGLTEGLALVSDPWGELAARLGRDRREVMGRVQALVEAGIIARLGVIVRHRALGWTANAMVVWDIPTDRIDFAGPALAATPGITLCYEREPAPGVWPYRLFTMIHGRSRREALGVLENAAEANGLTGVRREVLFSVRCFKQTGALVAAPPPRRPVAVA